MSAEEHDTRVVCRAITGNERAKVPEYVVSDYYTELGDHSIGVKHVAAYKQHAVGQYLGSASWDKDGQLSSFHALKGYEAAIGSYLLSPRDFDAKLISGLRAQKTEQASILEGIMIPVGAVLSTKVSFTLDITYTPDLAQQTQEKDPQIHFYLSEDNARGVAIVQNLDSDSPTTIKGQKFEFNFIRSTISNSCMLNIDAYAQHRNERNVWCTNQAGYANCPLLLLLKDGKVSLDLSVVNSSKSEASKGTIDLRVVEASQLLVLVGGGVVKVDPSSEIKKELAQHEVVITKYVDSNRKLYKETPATISSTGNLTDFIDECRKGYVPGSMFDVFRPPKAKDEYFLNCLSLGVQRTLKSSQPVDLSHYFLSGQMKLTSDLLTVSVMWMLSIYVTNCAYIMDEVDHNKRRSGSNWSKSNLEMIESFGDAEPGDTGDCEDFSRIILKHVAALKYHRKKNEDTTGGQILNNVVKILNRFVFCAGLCGVTSASIEFSKTIGDNGKNVKLQGHEAAFAVAKHIFFIALARYDSKHELLRFRDPSQEYEGDGIMPIEGTGPLLPLPYQKTDEDIQYQTSVTLNGDMRIEYNYHPQSTTNFYKVMRTLLTEEFFMQGCPYSEFLLYTTVPGSSTRRCGVWFHHMLKIKENKTIGLCPSPRLSPEVIESYAYVTKDDYPLNGFCAMVREPPAESVAICAQLNTDPTPTTLSIDEWVMQNYYISLDEMDASLIANIIAVKRATNSRVRCHLEIVRQNPNGHVVGSYVVTFFYSRAEWKRRSGRK